MQMGVRRLRIVADAIEDVWAQFADEDVNHAATDVVAAIRELVRIIEGDYK